MQADSSERIRNIIKVIIIVILIIGSFLVLPAIVSSLKDAFITMKDEALNYNIIDDNETIMELEKMMASKKYENILSYQIKDIEGSMYLSGNAIISSVEERKITEFSADGLRFNIKGGNNRRYIQLPIARYLEIDDSHYYISAFISNTSQVPIDLETGFNGKVKIMPGQRSKVIFVIRGVHKTENNLVLSIGSDNLADEIEFTIANIYAAVIPKNDLLSNFGEIRISKAINEITYFNNKVE